MKEQIIEILHREIQLVSEVSDDSAECIQCGSKVGHTWKVGNLERCADLIIETLAGQIE